MRWWGRTRGRRWARPDRRGLTVIEMLVASMLGIILIMALGQLILTNERTWSASRNKVELQQELNRALDRMSRAVREAHSIAVVDDDHFQTLDRDGVVRYEYQLDHDGQLWENETALTECTCLQFQVSANGDQTGLDLRVRFGDDTGNGAEAQTWVTVRNRALSF